MWNGCDPGAKKTREEEEGHDDEGDHSIDLPCHDTEAVFEGRSIEANHLLGGKVGEEKGAGNDGKGKTSASEEKSVGAIPFVFTGDPNGERGGCGSEENEGDDS